MICIASMAFAFGVGEGRALRRDHRALQEARVLLREEAGLRGDVQRAGEDRG